LLIADRIRATAATPAGESQIRSTRATSRSPACSRGPAIASGMSSAGLIGEFIDARKSFSLVPK
jgi:hypothetical protein